MPSFLFEVSAGVILDARAPHLVLEAGIAVELHGFNGFDVPDDREAIILETGVSVDLLGGGEVTIDSVALPSITLDSGVGVTEHFTSGFKGVDKVVIAHSLGRRPTVQVLLKSGGRFGMAGFGEGGFGTSSALRVDYHNHVVHHVDPTTFEVVFNSHYEGEILYD